MLAWVFDLLLFMGVHLCHPSFHHTVYVWQPGKTLHILVTPSSVTPKSQKRNIHVKISLQFYFKKKKKHTLLERPVHLYLMGKKKQHHCQIIKNYKFIMGKWVLASILSIIHISLCFITSLNTSLIVIFSLDWSLSTLTSVKKYFVNVFHVNM